MSTLLQCGPEAAEGACTGPPSDMNEGLKFFGNRICPFAQRSWWTALELQAPIEYIHVDFVEKAERGHMWVSNGKPQWYIENVSPVATFPTLIDEGVPYYAVKVSRVAFCKI